MPLNSDDGLPVKILTLAVASRFFGSAAHCDISVEEVAVPTAGVVPRYLAAVSGCAACRDAESGQERNSDDYLSSPAANVILMRSWFLNAKTGT